MSKVAIELPLEAIGAACARRPRLSLTYDALCRW